MNGSTDFEDWKGWVNVNGIGSPRFRLNNGVLLLEMRYSSDSEDYVEGFLVCLLIDDFLTRKEDGLICSSSTLSQLAESFTKTKQSFPWPRQLEIAGARWMPFVAWAQASEGANSNQDGKHRRAD